MKQRDELLDLRIQNELGVDVKKYRNQEVADNFAELVVFPIYVLKWGIRPVIIALILFICGFFVFDLVHVEYVFYSIFGLILFLISGFLSGVVLVLWKMEKDMWGIIDYSLDILKSSVNDLKQVNVQITKENRSEVLSLLFNGIIRLVTVPVVSSAISKRIPFIGFLFVGIFKRILSLVAHRLTFNEAKIAEIELKEGKEIDFVTSYSKYVSLFSSGLEKVVDITFRIATFPVVAIFVISLLLLFGLIYLVH